MTRGASIIVDLGFGDAGKGLVTDFLARELGAHTVVRFNGGAQAGHNVVTPDGRHHTFAQLGAATFVPGVRTFLSRFMVVHPTGLIAEAAHLASCGVHDALERLEVSASALVTTPFHQAACQLRELARGKGAHGSCGIGVGETVMDSLAPENESVHMRDLDRSAALLRTLLRIQERKREELADAVREFPSHSGALTDRSVAEAWIVEASKLRERITIAEDDRLDAILSMPGHVIFEGAQGVLLDEWRGFHPHTTWSTCTPENALALIGDRYDGEVVRYGVLRTYATRHGAGPFPTEDRSLALSDPNNVTGPWQGTLRFGHLDAVLLRYAIEACGGIDALALTHLDALPRLERWQACASYTDVDAALFDADYGGAKRLRLGPFRDLEHQERITRALSKARPGYRELDRGAPIAAIEGLLDRPVRIASSGPSSSDVRFTR
jgi:adenylosuccinate synthase